MAPPEPEPTLHAEVLLRAPDNRAPFLSGKGAPPAVSTGAGNALSDRLRQFGFEIVSASTISISIAGPRELFSRIFGLEDAGGSLPVPEEIEEEVEGIYVQPMPGYFRD